MRKNLPLKAFLALFASLPLFGMNGTCANINFPIGNTCGTSNVPAVEVTVVDGNGNTLPTATIAFSVNGSQYYVGSCTGDCENFAIAYDTSGQFNVSVISPGYQQVNRVVNVGTESDGCTPVTENLVLVMQEDTTVAVLAGAWRAQTVYGQIDLRFGNNGEAIGAILYNRTVAGDGNFYVSYNGHAIKGVSGQDIASQSVSNPTRTGDLFNFNGEALGVPIGFIDATMSDDFSQLSGGQPGAQSQGLFVTYTRLADIPDALQDAS